MRPWLIAILSVLLAAHAAHAQEQVTVTSDKFLVEENANQATFSGNVVIVQGTMTVWSDVVIVHYGAEGSSQIDKIDMVDNVRIKTPDQDITGRRGHYDPDTEIMTVIGNVRAVSESGVVTGDEMVVNLQTNVTEFTNQGGGRVTGVFNP